MAQEVQEVIPEAVSGDARGYLIVNNDPIIWAMLNAIKEQHAQIRSLRHAGTEKDAQIQKLTREVSALRAKDEQIRKLAREVEELKGVQRELAALETRLTRDEGRVSTVRGGAGQHGARTARPASRRQQPNCPSDDHHE